jgi:hypothetical protein
MPLTPSGQTNPVIPVARFAATRGGRSDGGIVAIRKKTSVAARTFPLCMR